MSKTAYVRAWGKGKRVKRNVRISKMIYHRGVSLDEHALLT